MLLKVYAFSRYFQLHITLLSYHAWFSICCSISVHSLSAHKCRVPVRHIYRWHCVNNHLNKQTQSLVQLNKPQVLIHSGTKNPIFYSLARNLFFRLHAISVILNTAQNAWTAQSHWSNLCRSSWSGVMTNMEKFQQHRPFSLL